MTTAPGARAVSRERQDPSAWKLPGKEVPRRMRRVFALDDLGEVARRHMPRPLFGYIAGAAEDGVSFEANRRDFGSIGFVPRGLRTQVRRDQTATLFGRIYAHPFAIAPMGMSALSAYDGDVVLARSAAERGIFAVMSATSLTPLERVAEEAGSRWFQAYLPGDEARILPMVDRVAAAGYENLVVTIDVQVKGNSEGDLRNGFATPLRPTPRLFAQGLVRPAWLWQTAARTLLKRGMPHFENLDVARGMPILARNLSRSFTGRESLSWRHIEIVRERWKGRLLLKGVLAAEDAAKAREIGCDGLIVSNHGGRQLDGAISSIAALPAVKAKAGEMTLMLDSGVRRGTDVLKALALGADFVLVGRPFMFAAAVAGEAGVGRAIDLLAAEIDRDMALLGIANLSEMTPELLALPDEQRLRRPGGSVR